MTLLTLPAMGKIPVHARRPNAPASGADVNGFLKAKSSFVPQMFLWTEAGYPRVCGAP
jgi:hypothetical protein